MALVRAISPHFMGKDPMIVSGALADLFAILLAGHTSTKPDETPALRERMIDVFLTAVRALVPLNEIAMAEMDANAQAATR